MPMIAPPEGLSEADFDLIEAAVMETVRGRWFLAEFARRNRLDEMQQMLDLVGRLEQSVRDEHAGPADPSIRTLVQRLKEVTQNLDHVTAAMRLKGLDEKLIANIEAQARAVAGLLRLNGAAPRPALPRAEQLHVAPLSAPDTREAEGDTPRETPQRCDSVPGEEKLALLV